jgi:RES domain-containing protein
VITSWRITAAEYAESAFDGEGARGYGGRWNSRGTRVVYTSSSAALAALELLVRIGREEPLRRYVLFACTFEDSQVENTNPAKLPHNWRASPWPEVLPSIGNDWVARAASAVLRVPSAVIETEFNYLLNPEHADFRKINIADPTPFSLDLRLLRR